MECFFLCISGDFSKEQKSYISRLVKKKKSQHLLEKILDSEIHGEKIQYLSLQDSG